MTVGGESEAEPRWGLYYYSKKVNKIITIYEVLFILSVTKLVTFCFA